MSSTFSLRPFAHAAALVLLGLLLAVRAYPHEPYLLLTANADGTFTAEAGFSDLASPAGLKLRLRDPATSQILAEHVLPADGKLTLPRPAQPFRVIFEGGPGHRISKPGPDPLPPPAAALPQPAPPGPALAPAASPAPAPAPPPPGATPTGATASPPVTATTTTTAAATAASAATAPAVAPAPTAGPVGGLAPPAPSPVAAAPARWSETAAVVGLVFLVALGSYTLGYVAARRPPPSS